jgi:murein DD-endopeptidase MepM/ murein hydrolase activator NlpD
MCASRWAAIWPRVVAISLIGLGAASCSDSGRFSDTFGSDRAPPPRSEATGSIPSPPPSNHVDSRPLPPVASADTPGVSGGGRGMGSYQPQNSEITGSVQQAPPPAPPPPTWSWDGGIAVTVAPGETLETIAHKHGVPVAVIMRANHISNPAAVHVGQHLVIPRYRSAPALAYAPPATRAVPSSEHFGAPRTAAASTNGVHIVAPGETLNSIARHYGKPVAVLAKANNISPYTMVRVGERIVIPDAGAKERAEAAPPPAPPAPHRDVASVESPHSAWNAVPIEPPPQKTAVKAAEAVGSVPSFGWPVHGRVIAGFGLATNGVQNDGIDVSVPSGTPVKAADDGVVAYAGNELKGYGNLVLIRHSNGYVTAYAHASEILVKRGETVKRGEVIAKAGDTGSVKTPELHFEIRKGATPVDPAQFLNGA